MTATSEQDDAPLPGTVFSPRQVRILKIAVTVMGVLLVGGFAFVLAAIVYQASHTKQAAAVTQSGSPSARLAPKIELPVPAGAAVQTLSLNGDRMAIEVRSGSGSEIVIVDLASGKVLSRLALKPE